MSRSRSGVLVSTIAVFAAVAPLGCERAEHVPPAAHFHHLHLNSADPSAAIDYYARAFVTVSKAQFHGFDGFTTTSRLSARPGNVHVLFSRVENLATVARGQSAVAHFGWNVPDARGYLDKFLAFKLKLVPMYAAPDGSSVSISSDALPGYLTAMQIADAKAKGMTPRRKGGFLYVEGPDGAMIESYGDFPAERFTHIHMYHSHPICAQQWYARHLGAYVASTHLHLGPGENDAAGAASTGNKACEQPFVEPTYPAFSTDGRVREPSGYVLFDDVGLPIWPYRGSLVSTRGQVVDHIALSVHDLDGTLARLSREGIRVLEGARSWSDTRAAFIEGPDRVAVELIEAR